MSADEQAILESIEALANDETDLDMSCYRNCWQDVRYDCTIVLTQAVTGETILEFTCEYFKKPFGI